MHELTARPPSTQANGAIAAMTGELQSAWAEKDRMVRVQDGMRTDLQRQRVAAQCLACVYVRTLRLQRREIRELRNKADGLTESRDSALQSLAREQARLLLSEAAREQERQAAARAQEQSESRLAEAAARIATVEGELAAEQQQSESRLEASCRFEEELREVRQKLRLEMRCYDTIAQLVVACRVWRAPTFQPLLGALHPLHPLRPMHPLHPVRPLDPTHPLHPLPPAPTACPAPTASPAPNAAGTSARF